MKDKVFIDIDVISNWKNKLIDQFSKDIETYQGMDLTDVDIKDMWRYFNFPKFIEVRNDRNANGVEFEEGIQEVAVIQDELAEYEPSLEYFNNYLSDKVVEIFGSCLESEKGLMFKIITLNRKVDVTVYSRYKGKIRPSQLFFLANYGYDGSVQFFEADEIKMIENKIDTIEKLKEILND